MKSVHKTLLASLLLGASTAPTHAAVLYHLTGPQLVNEANVSLSPGVSRDNSATGTLYFRYTVTNPASNSTTENYFAGLQFNESGSERLGIGNTWDFYAYSAFATATGDRDLRSANPDGTNGSGDPYQLVESTDMTTIVFRVDYVNGGDDTITVWLNPNLGLTETAQSSSLTTNFFANATFNDIVLREGGGGDGWTFSDVAIAESFSEIAAIPEPSATLLGAFGLIGVLRRRR